MTAADFRARQRIEANDSGSVYADALYDGWRDDALATISRAVPFAKTAAIAVVDGTTEYALPTDWITSSSDDLALDGNPLYRLTTNTGAILVLGTDVTIRGRTLVLWSDPDYTGNWTLTYGGTWLITDLPNDWVPIALDVATSRVYDRRATEAAAFFSYDNGVEKVDRRAEAEKWVLLRDQRLATATAAIAALTGDALGTFRFERT